MTDHRKDWQRQTGNPTPLSALDAAEQRAEEWKRIADGLPMASEQAVARVEQAEQRAVQAEKELALSKKFANDLFDLERKAEARLAETLKALERIEANRHLPGATREIARAALTTHPEEKP